MRDLKLNTSHDLDLNSDLIFIDERFETVQSVAIRILLIRGECVWDYLAGVPWLNGMFDVRVPNIQKEFYLREVILGTDGVRSIIEFTFYQDTKRVANVFYHADTIYGPIEGEVSV
jgi:hypothetical protein